MEHMMNVTVWNNPIKYYCWLRREGYSPRSAALATLARFCKSGADKWRRVARWAK